MKILSKNRFMENGKTIKEYKLFNHLILRKETSKNTRKYNLLGFDFRVNRYPKKANKFSFKLFFQKLRSLNSKLNIDKGIVILSTQHCLFIANLIKNNLQQIGINCTIITQTPRNGYSDLLHIVICPNIFRKLPKKYISYQLEQRNSKWFTDEYIKKLKNSIAIFDYSVRNIEFLQDNGISFKKIYYMPVSYLNNCEINSKQEYDVLFYGDDSCKRRTEILKQLSKKFKVKIINNLFGDELLKELSKAKIILNIHYYENSLLETTRLCEALTYSKAVLISEDTEDMYDYPELLNLVDFVKTDDVEALENKIEFYLSNKNYEDKYKEIFIRKKENNIFSYYFYRFWLANDLLSFDEFYNLSSNAISIRGDFWCLGLPETRKRRLSFDNDNKYGIYNFPGLRHNIGWIGCGLSYKFMLRKAKDLNLPMVKICEDDVLFPNDFENKIENIQKYLIENKEKWDLFSGLIADVNPKTNISNVAINKYGEFIYIDKMVSTVFNIYNNSFYNVFENWDYKNIDTSNTIDRYIENNCNLSIITTMPFLVDQKEDLDSTLWNGNNTIYNELIEASKQRLTDKLSAYYLKEIYKELFKNKGENV